MLKSKRAPYEAQIKELERRGKVKFIADYNIYAVLKAIEVRVRWWRKDGKERQELDQLMPGMVLYPRPRPLNKWEKKLPEEEKETSGFNLERNQVWVAYRYPDIWAAIRQRGRHIVDSLTEKKVVINKEIEVTIPGEAQRMKNFALTLNDLTQRFLVEKITLQLRENLSQGVFPIYQELEGTKDEFKVKAAQLLKQAIEGKKTEIPVKLAEAVAKVLNRWAEVLGIVESCLRQAESWLLLCQAIEIKISWAYRRLAELNKDLSEISFSRKPSSLAKLKAIGDELGGILIYLNQEVLFDPYLQRIKDPAVQNLVKAKQYAEIKKVKPMRNLTERALAKLQAIVLREKPTITEIKRKRQALLKG